MPEVWQPIEGYEGLYEVSDLGRVRRLQGYYARSTKLIKQNYTGNGYRSLLLCKDGKPRRHKVHRLVAVAFVPGDRSLTVNHKDGNKENNAASNLEWATSSEQMKHAWALGLKQPPEA